MRGPKIRLATMNTITGMPTVPNTPIGSRTKILTSSQVSFRRARIIGCPRQFPTSNFQFPRASTCEFEAADWGLGVDDDWELEVGTRWELRVGDWELTSIYSRIECPVRVRNTSSRFGSSVLKSVTRIRCSAKHWITCVTRSPPVPRIVQRLSCQTMESAPAIA